MAESNLGSINIRPNKPDTFDGKRDFLSVSTWLFKVQQYLSLIVLSNPNSVISDDNRIMFASSFMTGTAASWWYTIVQSGRTPSSWEQFRMLVLNEFVPADHVRRARDKLRRLRQTSSVSKYLADFRNCILMIDDMSEGERFDRFVQGLKHEVRLEILKTQVSEFEEAARIALRVDSAIWSYTGSRASVGPAGSVDDPMEIGNIQRTDQYGDNKRRQRAEDIKNNRCVLCHKKHCRPWKCQPKKLNNLETKVAQDEPIDTIAFDDAVDSDQEN